MPSITVILNHTGTNSEAKASAQSFVKLHLDAINRRVGRVDGEGKSNPFTEAEVDGLSAARLEEGVKIGMRDFYQDSIDVYDERKATSTADDAVQEVRDRDEQTTIPGEL